MFDAEHILLVHMVIANDSASIKVAMSRKPCDKRQPQMKLEREPSIRSRYKPPFAHTHDFGSHFSLLLQGPFRQAVLNE